METDISKIKCCKTPAANVVVMQSVDGLKKVKNTFVHVTDNATTYFVDSRHQPTIISTQPLFIENYDALANPNRLRSQVVFDFRNDVAYVFNAKGKVRSIKLEEVK